METVAQVQELLLKGDSGRLLDRLSATAVPAINRAFTMTQLSSTCKRILFSFLFARCFIPSLSFVISHSGHDNSLHGHFGKTLDAVSSLSSDLSVSHGAFDWEHQWYPVAPVRDLQADRPNKVTLLGRDFCVWASADGVWHAFADACPHRLVPLSEGRIENGLLQCAYHGWEFSETGSCVRIPQLGPVKGSLSPAVSSSRACATSFPVRVEQELVWIFPSNSEELATTRQPALIGQLDDVRNIDATDLFTRDLPYSWDILVENLCDPSHVSFAHHSFMNGADRYNENQRLDLKIVETYHSGFCAERGDLSADEYSIRFEAPCLLYYSISKRTDKGETYIGIGSYCIPTAPGRCRLIARFPFRIPVAPAMALLRFTPTWINHFSQNVVLDSDVVFLASQDEYIRYSNANGTSYVRNNYYLPAEADELVRVFRKWLKSAGGPKWLALPVSRSDGLLTIDSRIRVPEFSGRDALLDRYRQHTQICSACRKAHQNLLLLRAILKYSSIGLLCLSSLRRQNATIIAAAILFIAPRLFLQPLISRLECVPWPRKRWLASNLRKD